MNEKVEKLLAELWGRFGDLYGRRLVKMILYGSQARGDAQEGSDIDVLVLLDGPVDPGEEIARTGKIVAELSLENDTVISCAFAAWERFQHERSPFFMNVRREGLPL